MLALFQHPDQLRLLRERPDLLPSAVEELLRYTSPVQWGTPRIATEPIQVGTTTIAPGGMVSAGIAAADHDPARFPDPGRLDITRAVNPHLAFGHGIHYCLGAPLARQEGRIAIGSLLRRFPDIALAVPPDRLRWRAPGIIRGLITLPVRPRAGL
jgi:cytochrome P450